MYIKNSELCVRIYGKQKMKGMLLPFNFLVLYYFPLKDHSILIISPTKKTLNLVRAINGRDLKVLRFKKPDIHPMLKFFI